MNLCDRQIIYSIWASPRGSGLLRGAKGNRKVDDYAASNLRKRNDKIVGRITPEKETRKKTDRKESQRVDISHVRKQRSFPTGALGLYV